MQGAAVTVGYVAAPVSLLVAPSMTAGDGVDVTTTKWLLEVAEGGGAGGEEEEREEGGEELLKRAQGIVNRAASLPDLTSSSSSVPGRRKRKKRKKPKLPKSSSSGCWRLCALQRQVPAVQGVCVECASASDHRRLLDIPDVQQRQGRGLMVQKTVVPPQLQFIAGRRHPCRGAAWSRLFCGPSRFSSCSWTRLSMSLLCGSQVYQHPCGGAKADHHDQAVQQTIEISQLQFVARWSMSLVSGSCRFSGAGGDSLAPTVAALRKSLWSQRSCGFHRCRSVDDSRDPTVAARRELDVGPAHGGDELMG